MPRVAERDLPAFELGELDSELRRALLALSPLDREALLLVAWEDLTPSQAAHTLGINPAAFRVRLLRARRRLRAGLEDDKPAPCPCPKWRDHEHRLRHASSRRRESVPRRRRSVKRRALCPDHHAADFSAAVAQGLSPLARRGSRLCRPE
jgi:hypothetical protein